MATSSVVKNDCDGSLVAKDATGTPISVTLSFCNGDLSIDNLARGIARSRRTRPAA